MKNGISMIYEFPIIKHIDDVLPHIKNRSEFSVIEKDYGYVINYHINLEDTFPDATDETSKILRECRGMIFDKSGKIIRRPLEKFFNVGEKEFTKFENIDWNQPHVIYEKLDGSMIVPFMVDGQVRFGTKAGITDVSMQAEEFVAKNPHYLKISKKLLEDGLNPIFEWTSRQQRIVLDYPEDDLVLLSIRHIETGGYASDACLYDLTDIWRRFDLCHINVVKIYKGSAKNMEELMKETQDAQGIEGYVIRFDNGTAVKIKANEYVRIHRAKDAIRLEKNVISMIMNDNIDDLLPLMPEEDKTRILKFQKDFWLYVNITKIELANLTNVMFSLSGGDKRYFAINFANKLSQFEKSYIFAYFDNKHINYVENYIKKNMGSQPQIDSIRHLFGDINWNDY